MKKLNSTGLFALLALGAAAVADTKQGTATQWITEYVTINDCSPISTTVIPCNVCTPCVVTAYTQCITSTTTSTYPTSTWCAKPGYYHECDCHVETPQWIYYDTPCEVEYSCPYQDWYYFDTKVVTVVVKVNDKPCNTVEEQWNIIYAPTTIYTPTTVVTYISAPTIIVVNNITINVTAAPTYITYTTDVVSTSTVTTTSISTITDYISVTPTGSVLPTSQYISSGSAAIGSVNPTSTGPASSASGPTVPTGSSTPISTFKLLATINGQDVVIMQESGNLVLTPATNSTTGVSFTLTADGELMTADGGYVSLTFTNGQAGPFAYGTLASRLRRRAVADGTYYGNFSIAGGFAMTIDGEAVTIQACGDSNLLSGGVGLMGGCSSVTVTSAPVDSGVPSSSGVVSSISVSTGSSTSGGSSTTSPDSSVTSKPTSTPAGSATTVSDEPTSTPARTGSLSPTTGSPEPTSSLSGTTEPSASPSNTDSSSPTEPTSSGPTESTSTSDSSPTSDSPSPTTTTGPIYTNGTNSTIARRALLEKKLKFKYN